MNLQTYHVGTGMRDGSTLGSQELAPSCRHRSCRSRATKRRRRARGGVIKRCSSCQDGRHLAPPAIRTKNYLSDWYHHTSNTNRCASKIPPLRTELTMKTYFYPLAALICDIAAQNLADVPQCGVSQVIPMVITSKISFLSLQDNRLSYLRVVRSTNGGIQFFFHHHLWLAGAT